MRSGCPVSLKRYPRSWLIGHGVARSILVDYMRLVQLDTVFPYCWDTGEVFASAEDFTTMVRKRHLDVHVPFNSESLPVRPARFVCWPATFDWICSWFDIRFWCYSGFGLWYSWGGPHKYELAPYPDDNEGRWFGLCRCSHCFSRLRSCSSSSTLRRYLLSVKLGHCVSSKGCSWSIQWPYII